jgi:predicted nucleotidyltransferase
MGRAEIIEKLRKHEQELKAAGVVHLHLHGSYARQTEVKSLSDIDLIAEFDTAKRLTLLDLVAIEKRLNEMLGVPVDLADSATLKEPAQRRAEREAHPRHWQPHTPRI